MSILTRDANSLGFRHIFLLLLSKSVWGGLDVQNIADYLWSGGKATCKREPKVLTSNNIMCIFPDYFLVVAIFGQKVSSSKGMLSPYKS